MLSKRACLLFMLYLLGCCYTAPGSDASLWLWFIAMAGLLVFCFANRRSRAKRAARKKRAAQPHPLHESRQTVA